VDLRASYNSDSLIVFTPASNRVSDDTEIRRMVADAGAAELIATGPDGYPQVTLLPIIWTGDVVLAHMARANPHWKDIADGAPVLLVCTGAQADVSPSWYPSKAEHGEVVPTWNYSSVQLRGTVRVHQDPEWLRRQVTALTEQHERGRPHPWHVSDAPAPFVDQQLRGIVGIEVAIERVDAKAKLSQNRSTEDQDGVIAGLTDEHAFQAAAVADAMRAGRARA
jgi:transcriptional regulator